MGLNKWYIMSANAEEKKMAEKTPRALFDKNTTHIFGFDGNVNNLQVIS